MLLEISSSLGLGEGVILDYTRRPELISSAKEEGELMNSISSGHSAIQLIGRINELAAEIANQETELRDMLIFLLKYCRCLKLRKSGFPTVPTKPMK